MSCLPQKAQTARGAPTSLHYVKFCITHTKSHNLHFCLLKPLCILEHVPVLKKRVKSECSNDGPSGFEFPFV